MPGLNIIKVLAHLNFLSKGLKLPVNWKQPQGDPDAQQFGDAYEPADKAKVPQLIPPFFMPHCNGLRDHVEACDTIGKEMKEFIDTMLDAVKFAHDMWKLQAKFKDLKIIAVTAIGSPGCLDGPSLESNIKNAPMCVTMTGNYAKYRDAVAKGVAKAFENWQKQVMVPGLPWYPAFAAFPAPQAPPMPNVPMPLIACISSKMTDIMLPNTMTDEMVKALDSGLKDDDPDKQHEALFNSIAVALSVAFTVWLPSQQVMLVLGKGPIPTFAPPYVPVGPVLGGDNIAAPGHLMA